MASSVDSTPPPLSEKDLSVGLRRSLYFHLGIALFVIAKSLVFPDTSVRHTPTLRVDLVGLPDLLKKDLAQIKKSPPPETIAESLKKAENAAAKIKPLPLPKELPKADPNEMILRPKKASPQEVLKEKKNEKAITDKNKNALARIKALAKIGAISESPPKEKQTPDDLIIKGNALSRGTSLSSDAKESSEESYLDSVRDRLQENWALPVWVARQKLSAQVQIFIDSRGRLRFFRLVKSSGNPQFDDAVKRAVSESQPYPAPPTAVASSVSNMGILVGFPL